MDAGLKAFLIIIGVAIAIGIIAFVLYKILNPKLKQDEMSDEEKAAEQLNRILEPVEDEKVAKEISSYKEKEDE